MNLFFMVDEQTDSLDADTVKHRLDIVHDALWNPHQPWPSDKWIGGEVTCECVCVHLLMKVAT